MNPDKQLAIHEAGHNVIAELLYLNPEHVTIEPTDRANGHLKRRVPEYTAQDRWRELLAKCAGIIAEDMTFDDAEISDALKWPDAGGDSAKLWESLRAHSDDPRQQREWFELAVAQTRRILSNPAVWRSVESLAARLLEKRTLGGWEAADMIDMALGNSKWGRARFQMGERYASPPKTWMESREERRQMEKAMAACAAGGAAK